MRTLKNCNLNLYIDQIDGIKNAKLEIGETIRNAVDLYLPQAKKENEQLTNPEALLTRLHTSTKYKLEAVDNERAQLKLQEQKLTLKIRSKLQELEQLRNQIVITAGEQEKQLLKQNATTKEAIQKEQAMLDQTNAIHAQFGKELLLIKAWREKGYTDDDLEDKIATALSTQFGTFFSRRDVAELAVKMDGSAKLSEEVIAEYERKRAEAKALAKMARDGIPVVRVGVPEEEIKEEPVNEAEVDTLLGARLQ